jgi:uncharacterized protein with HEPN domain
MPLNENDLSFLIDIIDCISDITEFTKGLSFHEFERDNENTMMLCVIF